MIWIPTYGRCRVGGEKFSRASPQFPIKPEEIFQPGKQPVKVKARSLFCYWAVRELGFTMADLAPKLNISQPAVSMSARRGERIASENGYSLMDEKIL